MTDKRVMQRRAERDEQDDLRELMLLPSFQRFAWRLLEKAGVFRSSFVGGDPHATAFNGGQRNPGLWLIAQLSPEELMLVLKDQTDGR